MLINKDRLYYNFLRLDLEVLKYDLSHPGMTDLESRQVCGSWVDSGKQGLILCQPCPCSK